MMNYMIYEVSNIDLIFLIAIGVAILLGLFIFFLAGLYHVKKDHVIIIEKAREFYKIYESGWHFKMPIVYQRVGLYCIAPQVRRYIAKSGNKLSITYQIVDVKTYHYKGMRFELLMKVIEKENNEITLTVLENKFAEYGLKFINIQKVVD